MENHGRVQLKVDKKDISHTNAAKNKSKDEGNFDEEDDLMQEDMALICVMCRYGKGKSNGLLNLRSPYNEEKWEFPSREKNNKSNVALWNYRSERENKGKQCTKKQRGMTAFYSVINKRSESSDEEGGGYTVECK